MDSLNHDNQVDVIEAFDSTSRYLNDLFKIDNPYFEGMVNQIYPHELQLNKANTTDTEAPPPFFRFTSFLLQMDLFLLKFTINAMTLNFIFRFSKVSVFVTFLAVLHMMITFRNCKTSPAGLLVA